MRLFVRQAIGFSAVVVLVLGACFANAEEKASTAEEKVSTAEEKVSTAEEKVSVADLGIKNQKQPLVNVTVSGQPSEDQIRMAVKAGIKHVVNLRTDKEMPFDEAALVTSLGMQYHNIPIGGIADLSVDNAMKFNALLAEMGDDSVLVHCASGNRVGAMKAIADATSGKVDKEAALKNGAQWGLTRLELAVRKVLATLK